MVAVKLRPSPRCRRLQPAELLLSRGHLKTSPVRFFPVVWKGAPTSSLGDIKAENEDQRDQRTRRKPGAKTQNPDPDSRNPSPGSDSALIYEDASCFWTLNRQRSR